MKTNKFLNKETIIKTLLLLFTTVTLLLYIRLIISARYYGSLEFAGKEVNTDKLPMKVINLTSFVTSATSYTTVSWMLALFTLIIFFVLLKYTFKVFEYNLYELFAKRSYKAAKFYVNYKSLILYFIATVMILQTFRTGFYSAIELHKIGGHMLYLLAYIPYFIVQHPGLLIVALMILLIPVFAPAHTLTAAERRQNDHQRHMEQLYSDIEYNTRDKRKLF